VTAASVPQRRVDRLVLVQAHCSVLAILGAVCLVVAADRLGLVPGDWSLWRVGLVAAAAIAVAGAVLPWLTAAFTVRWQRRLLAGATIVAAVAVTGSAWAVELLSMLGVQLLVAAIVLGELGNQRRALWWFWVTAVVLVVAVVGYHVLVEVQPRPE
jgi:hypothetical protein